jgi:hypothetical protein
LGRGRHLLFSVDHRYPEQNAALFAADLYDEGEVFKTLEWFVKNIRNAIDN